ncbi:carboxypeptidase regulatory-like domain-containing protein [Terriglobus tenax]|uniref:carboxypeptidase regulatory-like domain-containing protein n=1 Tax=Terriglobus tenax TaxID=1111115 RepID=UPI0021DFD321|nr:carboxypeptidase regulatory-like domain-containing protein [Terriglobus tenax]
MNTSRINGIVQDPTGAGVPGAVVVLTQTDTGLTRTVQTTTDGSYSAPDLPLGPYKIQVTMQGFQTSTVSGVVLQVGSNADVDVKLSLGSVTDVINVESTAGVSVETVSNGVGQVIDRTQVVELPLNGRDPTQLIALAGATTPAPAGDLNTNKNFPTITIAVSGGLANGVAYVLDGGNHNDVFNNLNLPLPFPDALQEFKSETSSLPAQYGNHASAAINAVTKGGSNQFHGDVFYFVRNYMFNAANYFNYINGAKQQDNLKRNQYGGVIGGPIKKDKLFFFGGYQGTVVRQLSNPTNVILPTANMLNGDFSDCSAVLTGPYVANKMPASQVSTQAKNIINKGIPLVSTCGSALPIRYSQNSTRQDAVGRVDYSVNSKQTIFGRYIFARFNAPVTVDPKNVLTANQVGQLNRVHALTLGHTYILSPNVVNSLRITGSRTVGLRFLAPFFDPQSVGINAYTKPGLEGFMGISITNGFSLGQGGNNPGYFNTVKYQLGDDVTVVRGKHSIAFGGQYLFAYMNTVNNRPTNGAYTFNGTVYGANTLGYADFFAGKIATFNQGNADYENDRWHYVALYAQDSWRASNHITLNYGLRWEPYIPFYNVDSHAQNFDMTRFLAGTKSNQYLNAPAGLTFPGDPGYPGRSYNQGKVFSGFQPRVGFIWDPSKDGTMSIRGGYGMFFDSPQMFFFTRYSNSPPWGQTVTVTDTNDLANPWVSYGSNPFPALATLTPTTPFVKGGVYVNAPINLKQMYLQQWNLAIQKQYGRWLLGATYLGNKTTHLTSAYELNPAVYIAGTKATTGCPGMQTSLVPSSGNCSTTSNTNNRRVLTNANLANGQYYATIGQLDDGGAANYNGMLLSVNRRAKTVNLVANYTWSHCLGQANTTELTGPAYVIPGRRDLSYSNCDSDRRHLLNVSSILTGPHFQERFVNAIFGGWGLSNIFTARSGGYFTVTSGVDNALSGIGNQMPWTTGNPYNSMVKYGVANGLITNVLNKASFTAATTGTYATTRPLTLHGPAYWNVDMSVSREFKVTESQKFQFRWETFNIFNHTNLNNPTSALNSSQFGYITSAQDPRIMQFAGKYIF